MNREIQILLILLLATIVSCKEEALNSNKVEIESNSFPYLIDTSDFKVSDRYETWLATANYDFLYIGRYRDTIMVDYNLRFSQPPPPPPGTDIDETYEDKTDNSFQGYYLDWLAEKNYKYWEESDIEIRIDTSRIINNDDIHVDWDNPYFKANPVMLINKEVDTILIGYGHFVPLIIEAKDSLSNWKPIEKKWTYMCGNGVGSIILPPNEIVITSAMIYNGDYETDLRLKIGKNYSKSFSGKIKYRQFESMFDDTGNYREEYIKENKKTTR